MSKTAVEIGYKQSWKIELSSEVSLKFFEFTHKLVSKEDR